MLRGGRALTGAWIETNAFDAHKALAQEVAPSRARGLKPVQAPPPDPLAEVAPSRARGLKPLHGCARRRGDHVAPSRARGLKLERIDDGHPSPNGRALTGAWIETCHRQRRTWTCMLAPM
nr:hypothetical protein XACLG97_8960005 [Xanthomonas citri pv. citri]